MCLIVNTRLLTIKKDRVDNFEYSVFLNLLNAIFTLNPMTLSMTGNQSVSKNIILELSLSGFCDMIRCGIKEESLMVLMRKSSGGFYAKE